ncbi:MAG: DUF4440 domain-containing protein [Bacteroidota bacterium]
MLRTPALVLLALAFQVQAASPPRNESRRQLDETIASFYSSIERGDAQARVALLDPEVILMPNGSTMIRGKEKVAEVFQSGATAFVFRLKDRKMIECVLSDSLAYTVNSYYYTWHKRGDQPAWRKTKNVHIWRKTPGGTWKLRVDIWNSDSKITFPGE